MIVPIKPTAEIDDITDGALATAIGTLDVRHAVAFEVGERLIMPAGPADRPAFRVPRL